MQCNAMLLVLTLTIEAEGEEEVVDQTDEVLHLLATPSRASLAVV